MKKNRKLIELENRINDLEYELELIRKAVVWRDSYTDSLYMFALYFGISLNELKSIEMTLYNIKSTCSKPEIIKQLENVMKPVHFLVIDDLMNCLENIGMYPELTQVYFNESVEALDKDINK